MKFSKLLVMGALLLMGGKAMAALDGNGRRIAPEPASTAFTTGSEEEVFYLYNTTAKMFFTQGNTWGTRGCVGPASSAMKMYFKDEGEKYSINTYICVRSTSYSWKVASAEAADGTAVYTDQSTGWGRPYWTVETVEGNVFRLQNTQVDAGLYMGRDDEVPQDFSNAYSGFTDDKLRFPISNNVAEGEGHHINWTLVSAADYEAIAGLLAEFAAAESLYALIEEAEALGGIDVTNARTLYKNESATVEDLEAEAKTLSAAIEARKKEIAENDIQNATGADPKDASVYIVNPSFDGGDLKTGWSGTAFGAYNGKDNAEHYEKTYDSYQDVTVKYPGLYLVGVNAFYRAGSSDAAYTNYMEGNDNSKNARLYATVGEQTVETPISSPYQGAPNKSQGKGSESSAGGFYIPNNMEAAEYYMHTLGLYGNLVPVEVSTADATLRIGVKKETTISMDWSIFDDFSLTFCGNGDDRWAGYAKVLAGKYPDYAGTTAVTESYKTAYLALKNNPVATDKVTAEAYIAQLNEAKAALDKNISLWKTYEDSIAYAIDFVKQYVDMGQGSAPAVGVLNKYLTGRGDNATKKIEARALTNEQLREELDNLAKMIKDVMDGVETVPGMDMTDRLTNPAFDTNDWTGWTREVRNAGNCVVAEKCAEAWSTEYFDIYQQVQQMPVGVYEISVQGFFRYGRGQDAFNKYNNGEAPAKSPTYIYMNANTTPFMNIFAEPTQISDEAFYGSTNKAGYTTTIEGVETTLYFPDGMSSAAVAFGHDMFINSAYGAVVNQEDLMRIGVKGSSKPKEMGDSWVIFDNFKLTFWGKQADKVVPALEGALAEMEGYKTGRVGSNVTAALDKAIADAKTALQTSATDGEALFAALVALYDIKEMARQSAELMDDLALRVDSLKGDITLATSADAYANMAYTLADAKALCDNIERGLSEQTISDDDVPALIEQINAQRANAQKCIDLEDGLNSLSDALMGDLDGVSNDWITKASNLYEAVLLKIAQANLQMNEVDGYLQEIQLLISTKFMPVDMDLATDENPVDATAMLQTPAFQKYDAIEETSTNAIDGWKGTDGYNFGNDNHQKEALAVEFYHKAFDMYQDIYGLRPGMYEVRANAFARKDNSTSTDTRIYADAMKDNEVVDVNNVIVKGREAGVIEYGDSLVFFTQEETIDEGTGEAIIKYSANGATIYTVTDPETSKVDTLGWVPNDMVSAATFFHLNTEKYANLYTNSVLVKIEEGQFLRLGMKTEDANTWVLMDDFQLIYYGAESTKQPSGPSTGIKAVEAAAAADVVRTEYFTLGGMRSLTPQKGINIMRQTLSNGMVVVKKVNLK